MSLMLSCTAANIVACRVVYVVEDLPSDRFLALLLVIECTKLFLVLQLMESYAGFSFVQLFPLAFFYPTSRALAPQRQSCRFTLLGPFSLMVVLGETVLCRCIVLLPSWISGGKGVERGGGGCGKRIGGVEAVDGMGQVDRGIGGGGVIWDVEGGR
ncbi:hypothetical protein Tco_0932297 [Tanacetum coccineum]